MAGRSRSTAPTETDTADRIVDGAIRAAEAYGLRRLTMDQIAKHTNIARVTIYSHFPNKDAVITAAVARELESLLIRVQSVESGLKDPYERFVEMFTAAFGWLRDNALLQRLIRFEPETILPYAAYDSPYLAIGRQWVASQLADMFQETAPASTPSDFDDTAELVVRVVQSLVLSPMSEYDLNDANSLRELARRWLLPTLPRHLSA